MRIPASALLCVLSSWLGSGALALDVGGRVSDADGKPLPHVRILVTGEQGAAFSTSVFSALDGRFSLTLPAGSAGQLEVEAFRIGWSEKSRKTERGDGSLSLSLVMQPVADRAQQVPPSAWMQGDSDSLGYRMSTLQCSNCHQLGAERVRNFARKMKDLPVDERARAWLDRAVTDLAYNGRGSASRQENPKETHPRVEVWEDAVQYMRWVTLRLGEHNELRWGLTEGSPAYNALLEPETSLFSPRDMGVIIPALARDFPVDTPDFSDYDDIEQLGEYGPVPGTVIQEYVLPTFGWTREIAIAPGSSRVWFIETDKDRVGALDPADGSVEWFDVPGEGSQGPHTMNADAEGNLWIALENSFHIGRFNTRSHDWRLYPPPEGKVFGVTHDFAYNSDRHVQPDASGRIWITDMGMNELWGLNVESGEIETRRMPLSGGETHFHSLLYGAAFDAANNRVWWAQLYGFVGSFDATANVPERVIPFERGSGPRRLAIQEDGILWIPLFGAGQLVKFDSLNGVELARYSLPDPGAAPYGVTLDKKRNAIWAATSNSDRIYRFDIDTGKWRHYPLPRRESFIRMIELDPVSGDVWTTYANLPVGKRDPALYGSESANNMLVRLRPGD
jgi:virginiamycin B lyase